MEHDKVKAFDFVAGEMVVAVKDDDPYKKVEDLPDEINIATSFPNIAKKYFEKLGKKAHIIEVSGAVEITPSLGLSDVVIDITSTGSTLKSNRLRIIDKILKSSAVVVARKNLEDDKQKKLNSLMRALNSVIDAQDKKYLMVHVPKNKIEEVKSFMPGLSYKTVTQLWGDNDNVVIHVVVAKDKDYDRIDTLK